MKYITCLLLILMSFSLFSQDQEKFSKEISFVNDNDLFVSAYSDRYYTNGMFLTYRTLAKSKKLEKKFFEFQIGHYMYTPHRAVVTSVLEHDRPFASYLYGSFGINRVFKNKSLLNTSIQVGVIGPSAYGAEIQDFIHKIYGFEEAVGWQYQISDALGLNLNTTYIKHLSTSKSKIVDVYWANKVRLGSVFTDFSTGIYTRVGFNALQSIFNSIGFNTSLNDDNTSFVRKVESFIYLKPMLRYVAYDATIEGSFLNDSSPFTKPINNLLFDLELGIKFTANRFHFGYAIHYYTKKSKELRYNGHGYGTISINYLIR